MPARTATVTAAGDALQLAPRVWPEIFEEGGVYQMHAEGGDALRGLTLGELARDFPGSSKTRPSPSSGEPSLSGWTLLLPPPP